MGRKKIDFSNKEFALYKGEEVLAIGTLEEISLKLNISIRTVQFYGRKCYKKRLKKETKNCRSARILVSLN